MIPEERNSVKLGLFRGKRPQDCRGICYLWSQPSERAGDELFRVPQEEKGRQDLQEKKDPELQGRQYQGKKEREEMLRMHDCRPLTDLDIH